jgi:hypothetical protein
MANKVFQENSTYNQFDRDGDGIINDEELTKSELILNIENEDKRQDAQRRMAWFALFGMLLYPFAVVLADYINLNNASKILGDMAPTYFVSVAAIVMAFYGTQAFISKK